MPTLRLSPIEQNALWCALVNTQTISVRQGIDFVRLGVNYKLDWSPLAANF